MIQLEQVARTSGLTKDSFRDLFLLPNRPVIIEDLISDWPARKKWSLQFFKENYGDLEVPVYPANAPKSGKNYISALTTLPFREYIESIENGEANWRLFLFNIFNHVPELRKDYKVHTIMDGFIKEFPFTFFGGEGAKVPLHYDIDMSNVFLSQFEGRKKVVLFSHEQSRQLYHLPFTVASYVDVDNPDYEKFPALRGLKGYQCILEPGDTLFIPSGYWHYITYLDAGFSMNQRSNDSIATRLKGAMNIATHYVVDKSLNNLFGEKWQKVKEEMAFRRAV